MSTFTPNLGLENPAYLSQPGFWGITENTARSAVDLTVGQTSFTLTGATFSITITPGAPTVALSRVWIFNGTPGVPVVITFSPNTAQNWVFVVNNTNQTLIFLQGSGTTVSVTPLGSNVIYFDGGGAAANVAEFPTIPNQPPGSVSNPSYSFSGFPDVGLFVPGASTLAIAANGATMAKFQSSGAGPSGLNLLGATMGPFVANAFSNLDLFAGGWAGPPCQPGYSFLYLDESSGQAYLKYLDSTSNRRVLLLGSYGSANLATYIGAPPTTVNNSSAYLLANETTKEVDLYFKDSTGHLWGPFGREYYVDTNQAIYVGATPTLAVANLYSYFQVNETAKELDFFYRDSAGVMHGPIPAAAYNATDAGAGPLATYVGAAPATINNKNCYFTVNEGTTALSWNYKDSAGFARGPIYLSQYGPGGPTTWVNTFVPVVTVAPTGWTIGSSPAPQCMYNYNSVTKTMAIQILFNANGSFGPGSSGTFTISLPLPLAGGSMAQTLMGNVASNPFLLNVYHFVAFGSSLQADYAANQTGFAGTAYFAFNGVLQTA